MNCTVKILGGQWLITESSLCNLLCQARRAQALEWDKRCLRRNSLDSVSVLTLPSTSRELFLPWLSIWRWIFMLCMWTLTHAHNFSFHMFSRSYPVDPCCMPEPQFSIAFFLPGSSHFALVYIVF